DIAEVIRAFTNNNEATKKRKREDNLRTWKWSDVIDVDDLSDNLKPTDVPKTEETTVAFENNNINGKTKLCHLFYKDESDQEEDIDEVESDQEEDLDDGWV
nr:hypothetical protein [Tanacetum cinerariifolium]